MLDKSVLANAYKKRDEILANITKGDVSSARKSFDEAFQTSMLDDLGLFKRIDRNQTRSLKNFLLSYNTQYFMAAQKGGMEIMIAHRLAERFALMIEDNDSSEILWKIHASMLDSYSSPMYRGSYYRKSTLSDKVDLIIEERFMEEISMDDIAKMLNVSKEHMMRCYKKEKNETINNKLKARRIEEAKNLLKFTNLSFTEIAYSIGYSTSQYFSSIFKDQVGLTPKEFNLKYKSKEKV